MSTMRALVMQGDQKASVISDRPIPELRPNYVLVKVKAVALNPTDWKHIAGLNQPGLLCGCDYAGTVEKVGSGVSKQWKEGDRICGMAHGGNKLQKEDGAFAEHIVARADVQWRIPEHMSFEEASTLGVGIMTVGQGLFQAMKLELPPTTGEGKGEGKHVLVYGGSTATGALGIQFLKLAGYKPITTCSKRNFEYVKSLGAAEAFDYNSSDCAEQIRKYTNNSLKYAWDCIALEPTAKICAEALASGPGAHYGCLLPAKPPRLDLTVTPTLAYSALGEPFDKGFAKSEKAPEDDFNFAVKWSEIAEKCMAEGKIKVHKPRVGHGLDDVLDGLDQLKNNKVSGEKLVYKL